jgi:hypothetical protein
MKCERYAVWWLPRPGSALAQFGVDWTGWCPDRGTTHVRRALAVLSRSRAGVPGAVRLRGLHATIRAPFRLAFGRSAWALETALAELAGSTSPIRLPRLRLAVDDDRVVLAPMRVDEAVTSLLSAVAETVRRFQAGHEDSPLTGAGAVTATGIVLANAPPGHPHSHRSATRFRIPLTDRLDRQATAGVISDLAPLLAPIMARPQPLTELALVGDPGRGRPWRLLERFILDTEAGDSPAQMPAGMDFRGPSLLTPLVSGTGSVAA